MHSAATLSPPPHRACGACGADENTVCHHQKFIVPDGYPLPAAYDVVACRGCGFVKAGPPATQQDSDYISRRLADWGVLHIFLVTGGGAMPLNDSIGHEVRIRYVCNHHEQASAMAAEAYGRSQRRAAQEFKLRSLARQLSDGRSVFPNLEDMYPFLDGTEPMGNAIQE